MGTYCSGGVLSPDETVQDEADPKDHARVQDSSLQRRTHVEENRSLLNPSLFSRAYRWRNTDAEEISGKLLLAPSSHPPSLCAPGILHRTLIPYSAVIHTLMTAFLSRSHAQHYTPHPAGRAPIQQAAELLASTRPRHPALNYLARRFKEPLTQKAPFFHRWPFRVRYKRPAKNPPKTLCENRQKYSQFPSRVRQWHHGGNVADTYPMNMKRKQAVVIRAPRLDGDSIPSMATTARQAGEVTIKAHGLLTSCFRTGPCLKRTGQGIRQPGMSLPSPQDLNFSDHNRDHQLPRTPAWSLSMTHWSPPTLPLSSLKPCDAQGTCACILGCSVLHSTHLPVPGRGEWSNDSLYLPQPILHSALRSWMGFGSKELHNSS